MEIDISNKQLSILKAHCKLSDAKKLYIYNLKAKSKNEMMQDLLDKDYIEIISKDNDDNIYTCITIKGITLLDNIAREKYVLILKSLYFPIIVSIIISIITTLIVNWIIRLFFT